MNAPNFNFDAEGRSDLLPSTAANASRSVRRESSRVVANYPDSEKFDAQEPTADFRKVFFTFLGLALKYRWLILAFCGVGLAIGFILTFTSTPIYQAIVTIQIDRQAQKVVKFDGPDRDVMGGEDLRFYQTQYDLLKSRSLAERVAADHDLAAASDFINPLQTSAWGKLLTLIFSPANTATKDNGGLEPVKDKGNFEQRKAVAAGIVQSGVSIAPVRNSSLVRISFDSVSPTWAQKIANGVAESYAAQI